MTKYIFLFCALLSSTVSFAQFSINGNAYDYKNEVGHGSDLNNIYILNSLSGATLTYTSETGGVSFYKYTHSISDRVLIPSSEISISSLGGTTIYQINNLEADKGYIAEAGARSHTIWIGDYSKHTEDFQSLSTAENELDKCSYIGLDLDKTSTPIKYFERNGAEKNVIRKYTLTYNSLNWNSVNENFDPILITNDEYIANSRIDAPFTNTEFTIVGDQIAKHFGIQKSITSATYEAVRVSPHLIREIVSEGSTSSDGSSSGDSDMYNAPTEMNFFARSNEPATTFYSWKVYHNNTNMEGDPDYIYADRDINFTFTESGTYNVVLNVASNNATCESSQEISFKISESFLDIPNYFSPGSSSDSETNLFKVSHKSLIKFKCTIFNRWGNKIFEWSDATQGWDGKYKGSYVSPGVYFYVIDAEGSDGIKYKKGGDINILIKK